MVENFKVLASPSTARLFSAWIERRLANNRVARHLTFRYGGSFHTVPYLSRNIPQFLIGVGGHKTNNILVEWLSPKRILHFQSNKVTGVAEMKLPLQTAAFDAVQQGTWCATQAF